MIARSRLPAGSRMEPTVDALPPQLDDEKWRLISDLFVDPAPDPAGGRPRANASHCFEGILWVLRSGARWKDLPKSFPSYVTCWRRFVAWSDQGLFDKAMRRLVDRLDRAGKVHHEQGFADGTFSSAKKGVIASVPPNAARGPRSCCWSTGMVCR